MRYRGVALDLGDAGTEVQAVIDLREHVPESPMVHATRGRGVPIYAGYALTEAIPADGQARRFLGAAAARITREGETDGAATVFDCDLICMS